MKVWLMFALSAAMFWGAYVPTIFYGQQAFGPTNPNRSMRAFLFIGLAYFVLAILVPGIFLFTNQSDKDPGFTMSGAMLSTLAGVLGAAGALSVVFALKYAGMANPKFVMYVAPIVFAGAPIINVLISWLVDAIKGHGEAPNFLFILGLLISVEGVVLVLLNNPAQHAPAPPASTAPATSTSPGTSSAPATQH